MKKHFKKLIIGFIVLWVLAFAVMWGKSLFKNGGLKGFSFFKNKASQADKKAGPPGPEGQEAAAEAVPVRCYKISLMDFKDDLPVMGTVKGVSEVPLKFEINGVIQAINFREGDMISAGEVIASLDKKDAQLKVEYSKSKLDSAKTQALSAKKKYDILKQFYDIGGIIKAKLEEGELEAKSAELQAKSAEVELRSAESEFKKTDLYAPREGVLGSRDTEVGEFVTSQNKVATLYDTREVFVELGIVEKDIDKIALGQKVVVTADAHSGSVFNGTVDYVFPVVEGKSRTLTVKVKIQNPDALLLPGMFARSMITVAEFKNAVVIPSLALNKTEEGYKVSVVDSQNKAHIKPVKVQYITTDYSVIGEGLSEGELVVTETPQELKEETLVEITETQEATPPGK
jgi:RND family efflux transporter MFP subunit